MNINHREKVTTSETFGVHATHEAYRAVPGTGSRCRVLLPRRHTFGASLYNAGVGTATDVGELISGVSNQAGLGS